MEIIEIAGRIDFAKIIDLIKEEWPKEWGESSEENMIIEFEKTSNYEYDINKFLYDNDKIIGWYRYSAWPREEKNKENAHTLDIVINPKYQGRGLGRMLMEDQIHDCRRRGFKKLMSRTIEGNISSYKLHEKNGFNISFRKGTDIVWELNLE
jgi:L-amino acid N-acyltransferase YncA